MIRRIRAIGGRIWRALAARTWRSDLVYTIRRYRQTFGRWPNLLRPKTFNEWINHKKLFDRNPLLTLLADKYQVREYVRERVGEEILTRLYLVTEDPEEIDFARLPDRFVIKTTHGSTWNILVPNKQEVDERAVKDQCAEWLRQNYYTMGREWAYKNIKPRIIVEEFLGDESGEAPCDFKFFCFGGVVKFIQVDADRFRGHKRDLYDTSWNRLNVRTCSYRNLDKALPKPEKLDEMMFIAQRLADGLDFVRVDLYDINGRIYFGEMTNYPDNGFSRIEPDEYDFIFGSYWPRRHRGDARRASLLTR